MRLAGTSSLRASAVALHADQVSVGIGGAQASAENRLPETKRPFIASSIAGPTAPRFRCPAER